jgi:LPS export ABC transporter protein LptC
MRTPATAAFLFLFLGWAGCQVHDPSVTVDMLREDDAPSSESWETTMMIMEEGLNRLHMRAHHMARFETPDSTWMVLSGSDDETDRVRVVLFGTEGDTSAVVTAQRIVWHERTRRFVARGDVRAEAGEERSLRSEHLAWMERTARIGTPGFATIRTPTETLSGYGLDADENLTDFTLARVTGTVLIPDE